MQHRAQCFLKVLLRPEARARAVLLPLVLGEGADLGPVQLGVPFSEGRRQVDVVARQVAVVRPAAVLRATPPLHGLELSRLDVGAVPRRVPQCVRHEAAAEAQREQQL